MSEAFVITSLDAELNEVYSEFIPLRLKKWVT